MALPKICTKIRAHVVAGEGFFLVEWGGNFVANFPRLSPAKTFAKRLNSMFAWLGQCSWVDNAAFVGALQDRLIIAESGDGRYRPPIASI